LGFAILGIQSPIKESSPRIRCRSDIGRLGPREKHTWLSIHIGGLATISAKGCAGHEILGRYATIIEGFARNLGELARYWVLIIGLRLGRLPGDGEQSLMGFRGEGRQWQWHMVHQKHVAQTSACRTGTMRGNARVQSVHANRIHMRKNNIHGIAIIKQLTRDGEAGEEEVHLCSMSLVWQHALFYHTRPIPVFHLLLPWKFQ